MTVLLITLALFGGMFVILGAGVVAVVIGSKLMERKNGE